MARRRFELRRSRAGNRNLVLHVEPLEERRLLAPLAVGDFYRLDAGATLHTGAAPSTQSERVFYTDFNATRAPAEFSGITTLAGVAGYNGIGQVGNRFTGSLLRNQTGMAFDYLDVPYSPAVPTRLTLTNLPPHTSLDLNFLFAALDSWDGNTQYAAPDVFAVAVDGRTVFAKTFDNADRSDQDYVPAPGTLLDWGHQLGFNSNYTDAAYDLGQDPAFNNIPHDSSTVRIEWFPYGDGWTAAFHQDESWGIDNVEVILNGVPVEPTGVLANDADPEGDGLTATLDAPPAHGQLVLHPNGSFDYTPAAGFQGVDSFTYHANDAQGASNVVTVQLEVAGPLTKAAPADDAYTVTAGGTLAAGIAQVVKSIGTGFDQAAGTALAEGAPDDDYQIGVDGNGGLAHAVPSVLVGDKPQSNYVANSDSPASRWIGVAAAPGDNMAQPGTFSFETAVDLTGYDPQSAYLSNVRIAADNALLGVWIDDVAVLTETVTGSNTFRELGDLGQGAFHAGVNRVRFLVRNTGSVASPMGLRVEGLALAAPLDGPAGVLANDKLGPIDSDSQFYSVPGTADPWLAGMPNGSSASYGDFAPEYSPVLVDDLLFRPGDALQFAAEGRVGNSHFVSYYPTYPPDGGAINGSDYSDHYNGAENGISNVRAPINSLVGVFLDDSLPSSFPAPATLNFGSGNVPGGLNYEQVQPLLRQIFFLGDGLTSDGTRQSVIVPDGATRLFLGTLDGFYWFDNLGRFDVRVKNVGPAHPDARPLLVLPPDHGTLEQWEPNGAFQYSPSPGYVGVDSFRYRLERADGTLSEIVTVTLNVVALEGDVNLDGAVNLTDFGLLKTNFGQPGNRAQGDLNGDAKIDLSDFGILKANFGAAARAAAADAALAASWEAEAAGNDLQPGRPASSPLRARTAPAH